MQKNVSIVSICLFIFVSLTWFVLVSGLPPIPTDIKIKENDKEQGIYIKWKSNHSDAIFVLESRRQIGQHIFNDALEWNFCMKSVENHVYLKNYVVPGWWYQFRVAAVNENGTRGFSEKSFAFISSVGKKFM